MSTFCKKCGTEMIETKVPAGYDRETGTPLYQLKRTCPNRRGLFSGHDDYIVGGDWGEHLYTSEDLEEK